MNKPTNRKTRYWIGIDIGKNGAIAIQNSDDDSIVVHKIPMISTELDYHGLCKLLTFYSLKNTHVVFEDLHAIFNSSAGATFSFGAISGATEMSVVAMDIPFTKVKAKVWQAVMFEGVTKIQKQGKKSTDTKAMALIAAKRLFPKQSFLRSEKCSKPDDGIVDAILMSEYCKRVFK